MGEGPEKEFWIGCRDPLPSSFGKANFQQPRVPQRSLPRLARCGLGPSGGDWGSGAVWSVVSGHPRILLLLFAGAGRAAQIVLGGDMAI